MARKKSAPYEDGVVERLKDPAYAAVNTMDSECITRDPKAKFIKECLVWLIPILEEFSVPYQIVGGLAAKFYGSQRSLVDLDFYADMRATGFPSVLREIRSHLIWGPEHFKDQNWDITFLKIDFCTQRIEIGDSNDAYFFDRNAGQWVSQKIDFANSLSFNIFGIAVEVMPKQALIDYKRLLAREVDVADLIDLE